MRNESVYLHDQSIGVSYLQLNFPDIYYWDKEKNMGIIFFEGKICEFSLYQFENRTKEITILKKWDFKTFYENHKNSKFLYILTLFSIEYCPVFAFNADQWSTDGIVRVDDFIFYFYDDRKEQQASIQNSINIFDYKPNDTDESKWINNQKLQYEFEKKILKLWKDKSPLIKDFSGATFYTQFIIKKVNVQLQQANGTYVEVYNEFCPTDGVTISSSSKLSNWEIDLLAKPAIINPAFFTIEDWQ